MPSRFQEMLKEQRQNIETSRAGLMWDADEVNKLMDMVVQKVTTADIAKELQRTEGSIKTRILSIVCSYIDTGAENEEDVYVKYNISKEDIDTFRQKKQKRLENLQQRQKTKRSKTVQEKSPYTIDDVMNLLLSIKKQLDVKKNQ